MTPEEIEILIQEAQTLIEQIRAETQKGGNTKERVANTLTKLNNILTELNERPSGGGDLTLEQARDNGNTIDGNILGNEEFDKGGDRKAFAQMSDVYDNSGVSIPTGTERQVLSWSSTGTAEPVRLGWKQLSDLPSPPTFSNGVLTGTAFQPDGTALFAFTKLAIDSPEASTIPFYQTGGKLLVENGTAGKEAVNFSQLTPLIHLSATTINIATATDINGFKMQGKSIVHDNTTDATITVSSTAESNFICEGSKTVGNLIFVAGAGITIINEDNTLNVNGGEGSSYRLKRLSSSKYQLSIRNL